MRQLQEEVILVKEGSVELSIDGKIDHADAGSLIFLAANANRQLTNSGDKLATYYVMDVYTDATGTILGKAADGTNDAGNLNSTVFNHDRFPVKITDLGSSCWFLDSPTRTFRRLICHTTTLNPGKAMPVGRDEADELIFVKSGIVESTINGVSCRLGPGSFFFQASNDSHSNKNGGSTPVTYEVIKIVTERTPEPQR
jgi:quercetin dioxygenase-like cupin family protein